MPQDPRRSQESYDGGSTAPKTGWLSGLDSIATGNRVQDRRSDSGPEQSERFGFVSSNTACAQKPDRTADTSVDAIVRLARSMAASRSFT